MTVTSPTSTEKLAWKVRDIPWSLYDLLNNTMGFHDMLMEHYSIKYIYDYVVGRCNKRVISERMISHEYLSYSIISESIISKKYLSYSIISGSIMSFKYFTDKVLAAQCIRVMWHDFGPLLSRSLSCLLESLFRLTANKPLKFRFTGPWAGKPLLAGGFPTQGASVTIISSDNGLLPGWYQAIIWSNAGILLIWTNFSEVLSKIHTSSFNKNYLKMLSAKFFLVLNVLRVNSSI